MRQMPSQIKPNQPYALLWHWREKNFQISKPEIKAESYLIVYL